MTNLYKTATALMLTFAMLLTGCADQTPAPGAYTSTSSENFDSTQSNSTHPPENSTLTRSESTTFSESESDTDPSTGGYPWNSIIAPDGSTIYRSESVSDSTDFVEFDFTYIRYAKPIFHTTIDEPDLFDWETFEFPEYESYADILSPNYFKAKPGDRLENGLIVKSAKFGVDYSGCGRVNYISFDGELTLTGILYCDDRNEFNGLLLFYADSTKSNSFPLIFPGADFDSLRTYVNKEKKFAMVYDNAMMDFGYIDYIDIDLSGVIAPGEYKKVRIAINNIYTRYIEGPNRGFFADLISVTPL